MKTKHLNYILFWSACLLFGLGIGLYAIEDTHAITFVVAAALIGIIGTARGA